MKKQYIILGLIGLLLVPGILSQVLTNRDEARIEFDAKENPFVRGVIRIEHVKTYIDDDGVDKIHFRYFTNYTHNGKLFEIESRAIVFDTLSNKDIQTLIAKNANELIRDEIDGRTIPYEDTTKYPGEIK